MPRRLPAARSRKQLQAARMAWHRLHALVGAAAEQSPVVTPREQPGRMRRPLMITMPTALIVSRQRRDHCDQACIQLSRGVAISCQRMPVGAGKGPSRLVADVLQNSRKVGAGLCSPEMPPLHKESHKPPPPAFPSSNFSLLATQP